MTLLGASDWAIWASCASNAVPVCDIPLVWSKRDVKSRTSSVEEANAPPFTAVNAELYSATLTPNAVDC